MTVDAGQGLSSRVAGPGFEPGQAEPTVLQTAPPACGDRPAGPGLTCGYMGGRSRVRTWVGLADGFTDRSLWPLGQPASCRHTDGTEKDSEHQACPSHGKNAWPPLPASQRGPGKR